MGDAQGTGFRNECCKGYKVQECLFHSVQGSVVLVRVQYQGVLQGTGGACRTVCRVLDVCITQGARLRNGYHTGFRARP